MLGRPSNIVPWIRDHSFGQFWKLGFCSVSECEMFTHGVQLRILLDRERLDSVPTQNMPRQTCITHRNPVLMHDWNYMPRVGIQQVSLKAYRR